MISLNLSSPSDLKRAIASGVPAERLLGFTGVDTPNPQLFSLLGERDIEVVFGTLGGRDSIDREIERTGDGSRYAALAAMGADIIATDAPLRAQAALDAAGRAATAGRCGVSRR